MLGYNLSFWHPAIIWTNGKSKSKSKKTLFNVGQYKQYNISSHLKWVLVADKWWFIVHRGIGTKFNETPIVVQ